MAWGTAIALALAATSTALQAKAQHSAGKAQAEAGAAQRRAAESAAELADYNAAVAEMQAQDALDRGAEDEQRFRRQVKGLIGSQRAGFAGANVDVSFGSPVDVQADAAFLGEMDALQIRTNAAREAWGYKVQAVDYKKRAEIARKEGVYYERAGQQAGTAANWQATGTIIGGGASLLAAHYGW